MPYNRVIDERIRKIVGRWKNMNAKKMFGGVCYLLNGNMVCGVYKDFLILRLGEEKSKDAFEQPYTRPFDITGRPMKGWVMVEPEGIETDDSLSAWLEKARSFALTLPPK